MNNKRNITTHRLKAGNKRLPLLISLGVAFAILGAWFLSNTLAATPVVTSEAEQGTISSAATNVADTSASAGQAAKFGAGGGGTIPTQCANGGTYLWKNLETCGWPGPSNTGPVLSECPGGVLTNNSGSSTRIINITTAGAKVSCQNITGCLNITAQNVTVENVKIACTSGKTGTNANGTAVMFIDDGASATITNADINGMNGVHACIWHQGTAMTASKVECYGANDGIFSWADTGYSQTTGDQFAIKDSYFHDFTAKTSNGHIDGYQTEGAANGLIEHNTFLMTAPDNDGSTDSAVAIWNGLKSSHDITVSNNLIAGGGFAIYAEDYDPSESAPSGGYSVTKIYFNNNKFSQHLFGCVGYYGVWYPRGAPSDQWRRSGNVILESGFNLDNGNPSYQGSPCT